MRPCTFSDRLCILPMLVTAQRPERPQTNKSAATAFLLRGSSSEQFRIHPRNPRSNFRGVSPPEGAGGGNETKAQQPFLFSSRAIGTADVEVFRKGDRYCGRSLVRRSSCWAIAVEVKKGYNCPSMKAIASLKMRVKRIKQGQSTNPEMLTIRPKSLFSSVF